jgi:dihydrofolate reductase
MSDPSRRRLSAFIQISLDGYYCDARGDMGFAHKPPDDEEWQEFVQGNTGAGGMLLFGRVTYELMANWWPTPMAAEALPEVAARMNEMPKLVASRTLTHVDWVNSTLIRDDLAGTVRRLKEAPGPDITILGSGSIVTQLADLRLLDELQVVLNPVAWGAGKALFAGLNQRLVLTTAKSRRFGNGSIVLWYSLR